jgi:hypothetical protein
MIVHITAQKRYKTSVTNCYINYKTMEKRLSLIINSLDSTRFFIFSAAVGRS